MQLKVKIWVEKDGELAFGRGRVELLEAIAKTGSISAAARKMGVSYRHAWAMLSASERRLGRTLVARSRGGAGGGGAALTQYALALIEKYRSVETHFFKLAREKTCDLQALLG